ncbi:MAG TPA: molybdenum cofactor biosynthesis protein B [Archangium sp.]
MGHEGHDHHHHHGEHDHHPHHGHAENAVACWVVTVSDTRTETTDEGGPVAKKLITHAGHTLLGSEIVKDDAHDIEHALEHALEHGARCVIFTGGTGVGRRDVTVETLEKSFEKRLDGFGELFRALSFQQIGSKAWLSRATAGLVKGALVFVLPGSPKAVDLAVSKLILPELGHAVREMLR